MPWPRQHWIRAASSIYFEACSNTRLVIHWARPGIETSSSQRRWVLNPPMWTLSWYYFKYSTVIQALQISPFNQRESHHLWWSLEDPLWFCSPGSDIFFSTPSFPWSSQLGLLVFGFFCFSVWAYGGSQAGGLIRAIAAGLRHSHSHARSEPCLQTTPQPMAMPDL